MEWGLFHGAFLLLEQAVPKLGKLPKALGHIYTLIVVCVAFVLFRADTFAQGFNIIGKMFSGFSFTSFEMGIALEQVTPMFIFAMIFGWVFAFPVLPYFKDKLEAAEGEHRLIVSITYCCGVFLLLACLLNLSDITYNPFIYFRF